MAIHPLKTACSLTGGFLKHRWVPWSLLFLGALGSSLLMPSDYTAESSVVILPSSLRPPAPFQHSGLTLQSTDFQPVSLMSSWMKTAEPSQRVYQQYQWLCKKEHLASCSTQGLSVKYSPQPDRFKLKITTSGPLERNTELLAEAAAQTTLALYEEGVPTLSPKLATYLQKQLEEKTVQLAETNQLLEKAVAHQPEQRSQLALRNQLASMVQEAQWEQQERKATLQVLFKQLGVTSQKEARLKERLSQDVFLKSLREELFTLEQNFQEASLQYGEEHPLFQSLKAQLGETQVQMASRIASLSGIKNVNMHTLKDSPWSPQQLNQWQQWILLSAETQAQEVKIKTLQSQLKKIEQQFSASVPESPSLIKLLQLKDQLTAEQKTFQNLTHQWQQFVTPQHKWARLGSHGTLVTRPFTPTWNHSLWIGAGILFLLGLGTILMAQCFSPKANPLPKAPPQEKKNGWKPTWPAFKFSLPSFKKIKKASAPPPSSQPEEDAPSTENAREWEEETSHSTLSDTRPETSKAIVYRFHNPPILPHRFLVDIQQSDVRKGFLKLIRKLAWPTEAKILSVCGSPTLAAGFAISYAKPGQTVGLIDLDPNTPSLHTLFGASNQWGLANLLQEPEQMEQVIQNALAHNPLLVIPTGEYQGEGLTQEIGLEELLTELKAQVDVVILNLPSLENRLEVNELLSLSGCESLVIVDAEFTPQGITDVMASSLPIQWLRWVQW